MDIFGKGWTQVDFWEISSSCLALVEAQTTIVILWLPGFQFSCWGDYVYFLPIYHILRIVCEYVTAGISEIQIKRGINYDTEQKYFFGALKGTCYNCACTEL